MTKHRGRKQRARRAQERTGASYTSTASGTAHDHGGPPLPDLDGADYGRQGAFPMTAVSRLLGACLADCQPCQRTLTRKLLDGQRILIAGLARDLYAPQPKISMRCSATTHRFHEVCRDGATAAAFTEDLSRHQLLDLLEDALDTWAGQMTVAEAFADVLAATPDPDEAAEDKPQRAVTLSCAYQVTAGAEEYLGPKEIKQLLKQAESSATGGPALECSLCDQPIDVMTETEVNLGLTTFPVSGREAIQPVWTHAGCGQARIWVKGDLDARRAKRGLPTFGEPTPPAPYADDTPGEDLFGFTYAELPGGMHPMLIIYSGTPHRYGLQGHQADLLTEGLKPVILSGGAPPARLPDWQIVLHDDQRIELALRGVGPRYLTHSGDNVPGKWRSLARTKPVLAAILPYGAPQEPEHLPQVLDQLSPRRMVMGGLMTAVRS